MWTRHYRTQVLMRNFLKIFPAWDMSCGEESAFLFGNPGAGRARRLDQLGEEYTEEKLRSVCRLPTQEMNRRGDTGRMDVCVYPIPGAAFDQIPEGMFSSQVSAGETNGKL